MIMMPVGPVLPALTGAKGHHIRVLPSDPGRKSPTEAEGGAPAPTRAARAARDWPQAAVA